MRKIRRTAVALFASVLFLSVFIVSGQKAEAASNVVTDPDTKKTGYHLEPDGIIQCIHKKDYQWIYSKENGMNPSSKYLKGSMDSTLGKLTFSNIRVVKNDTKTMQTYGTGYESVSPYSLYATCDQTGKEYLFAGPYACPDGYAGYSYFRWFFSYCELTNKWYCVGHGHQWLACARGDLGNAETWDKTYTHEYTDYLLVPNTYTVKYQGNKATSGTMADTEHTYDTAKKLRTNSYKKTGYTFTGWKDDNGKTYSNKQSVKNLTSTDKDVIKLYAQWKINSYHIVYNGNGATSGSMSEQTVTYGKSTKLTANAYQKKGYTFTGWKDDNGKSYSDKQSIQNLTEENDKTITLYAQWRVNTYEIRFDGNGATSGSMTNQKMTYGKAAKLKKNVYAKSGCDFLGWNTDRTAKTQKYKDEKEVSNLTDTDKGVVTLYAVWKERYKAAYIGDGQTKGKNFIDGGINGNGYSVSEEYTLYDNKEGEDGGEYFKKVTTVEAYQDRITGEMVKQEIESTVTGWAGYNEQETGPYAKTVYELGETVLGEELLGNVRTTLNQLDDDFYADLQVLENSAKVLESRNNTTDSLVKGTDIISPGFRYAHLYAKWDNGAIIEAYDRYYTLEEAKSGIITEEELLSHAKATDEELKSSTNQTGAMKAGKDEKEHTSFTVCDYQKEEFTELKHSAKISITYRAKDAIGNVTKKMIMVHVVDSSDTVETLEKKEVRFISRKYIETLDEKSIWRTEEYKNVLEDALNHERLNAKKTEALPIFGDRFARDIPGTGTWNRNPQSTWYFTHAQVKEAKEFLQTYGMADYVREDGTEKFLETFSKCRQ